MEIIILIISGKENQATRTTTVPLLLHFSHFAGSMLLFPPLCSVVSSPAPTVPDKTYKGASLFQSSMNQIGYVHIDLTKQAKSIEVLTESKPD